MIQLIQAATFPKGNQQRAAAENALIEHLQSNPIEFFNQMSQIFNSSEVPDKIRQAVGTIMAVSVLKKSKSGSIVWDLLQENQKTNIKNSILQVLIDPDRSVRRAAANIVSAICFIELPRNQWDGIVEKICVNISHDNQIVKEASILTLGFICSRIKQRNDFAFSHQTQESIITGIVLGIQQSQEELVKTSLKALCDSISSLNQILANQQYRQYLLKQVGDVINSGKFTLLGLQILGEFVKTVFESIAPYIKDFVPLLSPFITNTENEDTCVAAMEIWENIAEECKEASDSINVFTGPVGTEVVTSLLKNLSFMESEDLEGNQISDSANKALQTIFDLGSLQFKQLVLDFVGASITQNDWRYRQASIRAFALLLLGLPAQENQNLIGNSLDQLFSLLQDNSVAVQYATLESFVIISEVCGGILLKSNNFLQYLKLVVAKIYVCEKFLKSGCKIIQNICESDRDEGLGKFQTISDDLISALLQLSLDNNSTLSMINWSVSAMMSVIEVAHNEIVSKKYINYVIENFDKIGHIGDAQKREILASAFFTITQYCLHSLKNSNIQMPILTAVYEKVINYFKSKSDVSADGLYAIEALVPYFAEDQRLLDDFWVYIQHALTKWEDPTLYRATIICITALTSSYGEYMGNKMQNFVPQIIELMKNPALKRELKLDSLICLGQLYLSAPRSSLKFLPSIIEVVMISCSAAIGMSDSDFSYSESLKDSIVQCLMCIVHGLNYDGSDVKQQLNGYIKDFFQFMLMSIEQKYHPTLDYFKRVILLMADLAKYYPQIVGPFKNDQTLINALNTFKNVAKTQQYASSIMYAEQQLK